MRAMRKPISLLLAMAMVLTLVLSMLVGGGVCVRAAVSSTAGNELWLLADYEYALSKRSRFEINSEAQAAPYEYETGTAYLPLSAVCKYMNASYTLSGSAVTVTKQGGSTATMTVGSMSWSGGEDFLLPVREHNGEVYVSILSACAIFGLKSFYNDEMGLVVLSTNNMSYSKSYNSISTQIDTLSGLLFERPDRSTIFNDLQATSKLDVHPRILVDQSAFDRLSLVYNSENTEDELYESIYRYMLDCIGAYHSLFSEDENGNVIWKSEELRLTVRQPYYIYDENGNRLVGQETYTYIDDNGESVTLECDGSGRGDGYDVGGRSNVDRHTTKLKQLAFAWQITGEDKYADAFYLLALEVGKWEHWGEGHFLDCADGSVEFAIGFDWIYHAFDDEPQKRDEMMAILYEKGLMKGYYSIVFDPNYFDWSVSRPSGSYSDYLHVSETAGKDGWRTTNRDNNWQTVCGSGMIFLLLCLPNMSSTEPTQCTLSSNICALMSVVFVSTLPTERISSRPAIGATEPTRSSLLLPH